MKFSCLILAGGKSRRMGRDKSWIEIDGQPLIERQIELARSLAPSEIFISGRLDTHYSFLGCSIVLDEFPDAGPLAGIERGLAMAKTGLLLVLAVDMPRMERDFLLRLKSQCAEHTGVIPEHQNRLEPLAAFYPTVSRKLAAERLQNSQRSVSEFAAACIDRKWASRYSLCEEQEQFFSNWNCPSDVELVPGSIPKQENHCRDK